MLKAKDFRRQAREALKGKWLQAVIAGFFACLLGGTILYAPETGAANSAAEEGVAAISWELILAGLVLFLVIAAIVILIGSLVMLGYAKFNLALMKGEDVNFKMVFSEKKRYKDCFMLNVLMLIYIGVGYLLLVVPGVIAMYSYMLAPYIMYENPDMSAKEVMAASKAMMKGNKWRLFCLSFSFIGWSIVSALTFGIGGLFLCPYIEAAGAAFYNEIKTAA